MSLIILNKNVSHTHTTNTTTRAFASLHHCNLHYYSFHTSKNIFKQVFFSGIKTKSILTTIKNDIYGFLFSFTKEYNRQFVLIEEWMIIKTEREKTLITHTHDVYLISSCCWYGKRNGTMLDDNGCHEKNLLSSAQFIFLLMFVHF